MTKQILGLPGCTFKAIRIYFCKGGFWKKGEGEKERESRMLFHASVFWREKVFFSLMGRVRNPLSLLLINRLQNFFSWHRFTQKGGKDIRGSRGNLFERSLNLVYSRKQSAMVISPLEVKIILKQEGWMKNEFSKGPILSFPLSLI